MLLRAVVGGVDGFVISVFYRTSLPAKPERRSMFCIRVETCCASISECLSVRVCGPPTGRGLRATWCDDPNPADQGWLLASLVGFRRRSRVLQRGACLSGGLYIAAKRGGELVTSLPSQAGRGESGV